MKYYLYTTAIFVLLTGCQALKPAAQASPGKNEASSSGFLDNIAISSTTESKNRNLKEGPMPEIADEHAPQFYFNSTFNIEHSLSSQFKYAIRMDVDVEKLENQTLYNYIESWWGTPYRMGGNSHSGIDCSAFVQGLLITVYGASLPRVAHEQKSICMPLREEEKREGDLVFFNTRGGISHVGVYLHNNKFVHSSTSGGIMISDLNEAYWSKRYLGAGRPMNDSLAQKMSVK
ncbi:MAG: C40 family peptidase [Chitinophagaceae bacterium]